MSSYIEGPRVNAVLQVGSHKNVIHWDNHLPWPTGHVSFDSEQILLALQAASTLLTRVELFICQCPRSFSPGLSSNMPGITQVVMYVSDSKKKERLQTCLQCAILSLFWNFFKVTHVFQNFSVNYSMKETACFIVCIYWPFLTKAAATLSTYFPARS